MAMTWIFQANPDTFNVDGLLELCPAAFSWSVRYRKHKKEMALGHEVFLWRSIGTRGDPMRSGVILRARIIGPVTKRADDPASIRFWRDKSKAMEEVDRVEIGVEQIANTIISRQSLMADPVLQHLPILQRGQSQGTNYPVLPAHAMRLKALWESVRS